MSTAKFEAEKFNGKGDFNLWKIKMQAILINQGLMAAIKPPAAAEGSKEKAGTSEDVLLKAHSTIILCLGDKVLREVAKETSAAAVWAKLDSLYLKKSLANRLYMKQRLYSYKFSDDKSILDQLDGFNTCLDDLENIGVVLDVEDKAIMLLNALPKSYENLRDTLLFGRTGTITLEEVQNMIQTKELQKHNHGERENQAESLNVKKFKQQKNKKAAFDPKIGNKFQKKDQEEKETRKCHHCKIPGHLKKDCFAWKRKQAMKANGQNSADVTEGNDQVEVLNVMEEKGEDRWIMDSGCTYHICPFKNWFIDLHMGELGSVVLGNNEICTVKGIGNIKFRMNDGSFKILSEVRYVPALRRNLISLGQLEKKGFEFLSRNGNMKIMKNGTTVLDGSRKK